MLLVLSAGTCVSLIPYSQGHGLDDMQAQENTMRRLTSNSDLQILRGKLLAKSSGLQQPQAESQNWENLELSRAVAVSYAHILQLATSNVADIQMLRKPLVLAQALVSKKKCSLWVLHQFTSLFCLLLLSKARISHYFRNQMCFDVFCVVLRFEGNIKTF